MGFAAVRFEIDLQVRHRESSKGFARAQGVSSDGDTSNGVLKVSGSGSGSGSPSEDLSTVTVAGTTSGDLQNVVQSHLSTADGPYTLVDG